MRGKQIKGDKFIYLTMAVTLANQKPDRKVTVGKDNGMRGDYNFERQFEMQDFEGETLLIETKSSKSFADFSRSFVASSLGIYEYIDENGDNYSNKWVH